MNGSVSAVISQKTPVVFVPTSRSPSSALCELRGVISAALVKHRSVQLVLAA